jgi:hypothetical protein
MQEYGPNDLRTLDCDSGSDQQLRLGRSSIADFKQPIRGPLAVVFSYGVDGSHYSGKFYSSHEWEIETEVPILYNPQNPLESCVCDEDESQIVQALDCVLELLSGW